MANTLEIVIKARDQASATLRNIDRQLGGVNGSVGASLGAWGRLGAGIATAVTGTMVVASAAAIALGKNAVDTATSIESAFAGVVKTTEGLTSGFGVLNEQGERLKKQFLALAETKPISAEDLMRIGELGGQIGIASENLIQYTSVIADLAASTDLTIDAAATDIARLMNVMQTPADQIGRLGASLVDLGNKLAATEPEILTFAQRIAGAGQIAGLTEAQVLGISGAFSSVGVQAEAGGTAVQKVLMTMIESVSTGGAALDTFASTAGMTAQQFATVFRTDAGEAFEAFVEGLGRQGEKAFGTLEELGLADARLIRGFMALAGAGDLLSRSLDIANDAWAENVALTNEAGQRYATTASQAQMLKNQWRNMKNEIGEALLPVVSDLMGVLGQFVRQHGPAIVAMLQTSVIPAIERFAGALMQIVGGDWQAGIASLFPPQMASNIIAIATALGEFIAQVQAFVVDNWPWLKEALIGLAAILAAGTIAASIAGIAAGIASLASPIGLIVAAIALLATAWARDWGGIQEKTQAVIDWITPYIQAALGVIQQFWAENGAAIMDIVNMMWSAVQSAFSTAAQFIQNVINTALALIQAWWTEHGATVMAVVSAFWETIKIIFQTASDNIRLIIQAVQAAMHGDWYLFGETLRGIVDNIWKAVRDIFVVWFEALKTLVRDVVSSIVRLWTEVNWKEVGSGIIQGIIKGVKSGVGALKDAVMKAAKAALNAAKSFLGVHSPSKQAANEIGKPFIEGIMMGIDKTLPKLVNTQIPAAAGQMVMQARSGVQAQARSVNTTNNNSYNLNVYTSAPVEPIVADFNMLRAFAM